MLFEVVRGATVDKVVPANPFYARKFAGRDLNDFANLPFTTKDELIADQVEHPPYGSGLTYPREVYCRPRRLDRGRRRFAHQLEGWLDTTPQAQAARALPDEDVEAINDPRASGARP